MKKTILLSGIFVLLACMLHAQNDSLNHQRHSMPERKLIEMKKIISLSPTQSTQLRQAYAANQKSSDSILFKVADPTQAAILKYKADKQLQKTIMKTLTEDQKIKYLTVVGTPDVMAKADAKVQTLRESGQYSEEELQQKHNEIFSYLMQEKVVYLRDKYNVAKQRDNIHRLKDAQPASLKESDAREKLKAKGEITNGQINW